MHKYLANTVFTGKNLIYLPTCHSTNESARQLIDKDKASEGTIVITDHQTKGKGQRGNQWLTTPEENLTLTIIYSPSFLNTDESFWLTIITSLALNKTLETYAIPGKIKWPNDIYCGIKKVGGILIENILESRKIKYSIIGIGLNVNQQTFEVPNATSLHNITNRVYNLPDVFQELTANIEQFYLQLKNGKRDNLKKLYLKYLLGIDEQLSFIINDQKVSGIIRGVDGTGRLKVELSGEIQYFTLKEIKFVL